MNTPEITDTIPAIPGFIEATEDIACGAMNLAENITFGIMGFAEDILNGLFSILDILDDSIFRDEF